MSTSRSALLAIAAMLALGFDAPAPKAAKAAGPGLGRPVSAARLASLDLTIEPDGTGLPRGRGAARDGAAIYEQNCEACHGERGAEPADGIPRLTGGVGSLASRKPVRTVTSYWPHAPGLFDYIRRAMPPDRPGALSADETYAVTAYLLSIDGVVPRDATLDARALSKVRMPNANGFVDAER